MFRRVLFRNFSFIYSVSQWIRRKFTPAGQLILGAVIFAGIFGIDTRKTLAFQVFSLLTALLFIAILSGLYFRGRLSLKRILPDYASVGTPLNYQVLITNLTSKNQSSLRLVEELAHPTIKINEFLNLTHEDKDANFFDRFIGYPRWLSLIQKKRGAIIKPKSVGDISAKNTYSLDMELIPLRRGYINFNRSILLHPDPMNVFNSSKSFKNDQSLLILPKRYKIPQYSLPGKRKYQQGGINLAGSVGDSQEFMSLREYRPGDPIKHIHWRSLAKFKKPIVKEFQDEYFMRTGLILDTFCDEISDEIFEEAVSVAASFASNHQQIDNILDLMFIGAESYLVSSGRNIGSIDYMLEILACVTPCQNNTFDSLSNLVIKNISNLSSVICIFIKWDEKRNELLRQLDIAQIPRLAILVINETGSPNEENLERLQTNKKILLLNKNHIDEQLQQITDYY